MHRCQALLIIWRKAKLNGAVERCNGAWPHDFYATVDLPAQLSKIAEHVDAFQHLHNHHSPRGALDGPTPFEYLKLWLGAKLRTDRRETPHRFFAALVPVQPS